MTLSEIMSRDVRVIAPDATVAQAAKMMQAEDIGAIPVCDGKRLQGVITDRDITIRAVAQGMNAEQTRIRDIMTDDIVYGTEDQDVEEAAELMQKEQIRRLVVVDENKDLVGIVALGDLAVRHGKDKLSGNTLEAISQPTGTQDR